jgi:outer membrane protein OmpA-like peptidoglycan-associated protein
MKVFSWARVLSDGASSVGASARAWEQDRSSFRLAIAGQADDSHHVWIAAVFISALVVGLVLWLIFRKHLQSLEDAKSPPAEIGTKQLEEGLPRAKEEEGPRPPSSCGHVSGALVKRLVAPTLSADKEAQLSAILLNKRIEVDHDTREVKLFQAIGFETVDPDTDDPSSVRFRDEKSDLAVLRDIAEVLKIYDGASMCIEGHTEARSAKMNQWCHQLALNQAELVRSSIISFGVDGSRLVAVALPGTLGRNCSGAFFRITSF